MLLITLSAKRPGAKNGNIQAMSATPFSSNSSCARVAAESAAREIFDFDDAGAVLVHARDPLRENLTGDRLRRFERCELEFLHLRLGNGTPQRQDRHRGQRTDLHLHSSYGYCSFRWSVRRPRSTVRGASDPHAGGFPTVLVRTTGTAIYQPERRPSRKPRQEAAPEGAVVPRGRCQVRRTRA
jgi:hypothetical protein